MRLTKHEVKERLGHGGVSEIAKAAGRSLSHTSQVLSCKRADRAVARAVARRLRVKLSDLPPEYIGAEADSVDSEIEAVGSV